MKSVVFNFHICGMSESNYSKHIMIYKPHASRKRKYSLSALKKLNIYSLEGLIEMLKGDGEINDLLGRDMTEQLNVCSVYIRHKGILLIPARDKSLDEIFKDLKTQRLNIHYFCTGGASIHDERGYSFTVHPREQNHAHMPHVHVSKSGKEIRYSLETLEPIDRLENPHKRDNKKVILPFLKKNKKLFLDLWEKYMKGYIGPSVNQNGDQFYPAS